jgi:hypothetical protein
MSSRIAVFAAFCLSVLAFGQPRAQNSMGTGSIQGIRIKTESFDPQTRVATLAFINDSRADITAWGYCVVAQTAPGSVTKHDFCTAIDSIPSLGDVRVEQSRKPLAATAQCNGCDVIHPGQEQTVTFDFSSSPDVLAASVELNLLAFSDGRTITTDTAGKAALGRLIRSRSENLRALQNVVTAVQGALADPNDAHPAATAIARLESTRDAALLGAAERLRKSARAGEAAGESTSVSERESLHQFVEEQQIRTALFASYQIKETL